jgi:oxalate decarboxylase/phosphoglucose isomerase-like protein (cupin superfamily)
MKNIIRKFDQAKLKHEYGLDCTRLTPWDGITPPFGGAYCVVPSGTESLKHVNEPSDEEELFICISGTASVMVEGDSYVAGKGDLFCIPAGKSHHVKNTSKEDFHYYALWWNKGLANDYLGKGNS